MKNKRMEFFKRQNESSLQDDLNDSFDEFSKDANDGWRLVDFDESNLYKLDNKLFPRFSLIYPTTILFVIGVSTSIVLINTNNHFSKKTTVHNSQPSISRKKDITLKKVTTANRNSIQNYAIKKKNDKTVVQIYEEKVKEDISINYQMLPILHFEKFDFKNRERVNLGKETYLSEYKVVDYRFYRNRPLKETKNELLTGVPASYESNSTQKSNDEIEMEKSYTNYLEKTLDLLRKEKYSNAEERFEIILNTYELDVNALFYLAITKYKLKNYSGCLETLDKLTNARFTNFNDDADWFRLNCYLSLRDSNKFEEIRTKILNAENSYSKLVQKIEY